MRPLRVLKSIFGGFFLFATVVWLIMAIVEKMPELLASATIGAVASFFLLRKTKKDKAYSAKKKTAARGVVTEQTEYAPIEPIDLSTMSVEGVQNRPLQDRSSPACEGENVAAYESAYIYDKTGEFIGRIDGGNLSDADVNFLVQKDREKVIEEYQETASRGITQSIITDERLNKRETAFFNRFSERLIENQLNPGYVSVNRLGSGALNVYYHSCYVGKVYIPEDESSKRYRVIKTGNARATRVFDNAADASRYLLDKTGYAVEEKITPTTCWMQCIEVAGQHTIIESPDVRDMNSAIPKWVDYTKYCVELLRRAYE